VRADASPYARPPRARAAGPADALLQTLEAQNVFRGSNFVIGPISLSCGPLSERIYKICTSLSTGFVENIGELERTVARKPLPDAAFRGAVAAPQ
jgi:hypothetical protein